MKTIRDLVGAALLFFLAWHSVRSGYAARLSEKALATRNVAAATRAIQLDPGDPHAYQILGALLEASDDRPAAIPLYQTAVALRPEDYVLRMQLARGQELEGDPAAAIKSASAAVSFAPSYAAPHWQLGNMLIRAGRPDGGFSELRLAAASDPQLLPNVIDLAGQLSGGQAKYVEQAIDPRTPEAYKALFAYFKKRGLVDNAIHWLRVGGDATRDERRGYLAELINAKKFSEARMVWEVEHPPTPDDEVASNPLFNPGFESEVILSEPGFGWRSVNPDKLVVMSLDNATPKEGAASLRVDFNGATNAGAEIISQLGLVESKKQYRLEFYFRTENIVSGGLPYVAVVDANNETILGETKPFPLTTGGWTKATVEFATGDNTRDIRIVLRRQPCPAPQCPIFGKLWLDDFRLV